MNPLFLLFCVLTHLSFHPTWMYHSFLFFDLFLLVFLPSFMYCFQFYYVFIYLILVLLYCSIRFLYILFSLLFFLVLFFFSFFILFSFLFSRKLEILTWINIQSCTSVESPTTSKWDIPICPSQFQVDYIWYWVITNLFPSAKASFLVCVGYFTSIPYFPFFLYGSYDRALF